MKHELQLLRDRAEQMVIERAKAGDRDSAMAWDNIYIGLCELIEANGHHFCTIDQRRGLMTVPDA